MRSPRFVKRTVRIPSPTRPTQCQRGSTRLWLRSGKMTRRGSANAATASGKVTPCFARLEASLAASHSKYSPKVMLRCTNSTYTDHAPTDRFQPARVRACFQRRPSIETASFVLHSGRSSQIYYWFWFTHPFFWSGGIESEAPAGSKRGFSHGKQLPAPNIKGQPQISRENPPLQSRQRMRRKRRKKTIPSSAPRFSLPISR